MDRPIERLAPPLALAAALLIPAMDAKAQDALARASVGSSGVQGNRDSGDAHPPSVSADLRFVAFESTATNLVASDSNQRYDQIDLVVGALRLGGGQPLSDGQ